MGINLAGRARASPGIGAAKAKRRKRSPACPGGGGASACAPLSGGQSSISDRSRAPHCIRPRRGFEADRSISELKIGLERLFRPSGLRFRPEYSEESDRNGHFTPLMSRMVEKYSEESDRQVGKRIQAFEERAVRRDHEVAELSARVSQTPAVSVTLATLTGTTPAWMGKRFSRVHAISQCRKSKSSRSQTKPPFQILLACRRNRDSREIRKTAGTTVLTCHCLLKQSSIAYRHL
jgi:hypothetical protein